MGVDEAALAIVEAVTVEASLAAGAQKTSPGRMKSAISDGLRTMLS